MSSKNVKFSEDSDTSGSRISSHVSSHASHRSSRGHRRNDSESLSDYDNRGPVPEGAFSSADYAQQQLRTNLKKACAERDEYKERARELEGALKHAQKELHQLQAQCRGEAMNSDVIKAENKRLDLEKRALQEDRDNLLDENAQLRERIAKLEKKLNRASGTPPSATIDLNNPDKPKMHRSNSRSARDAPRDRDRDRDRPLSRDEQAEKDKARLSKRFERGSDESTAGSDGTSKTERQRRGRRESMSSTYIEPMGPAAARPTAPVPPSPTRHFPNYATSPAYAPQFASVREPVMASVPRSVKSSSKHHASAVHPSVLVQSPYQETGGYFPHPLPDNRNGGW